MKYFENHTQSWNIKVELITFWHVPNPARSKFKELYGAQVQDIFILTFLTLFWHQKLPSSAHAPVFTWLISLKIIFLTQIESQWKILL